MIRWTATVVYRTNNGPLPIIYDLEEIFQLHSLIENGPHWDTIEEIKIVRSPSKNKFLGTVEEALDL